MSVIESDDARAERRQVSRRTLVKVGANALWAVPAIQVVSAAPAFASVCSCPAGSTSFLFVGVTAPWHQQNSSHYWVDLGGKIQNNTGGPVSGLQLCITVPSGWTGVQEHSVSAHSDWVVSGGGSGATTIVFTWPGTVPNNGYWDLSTIQVRAWDYLRHQPTQLSLVAFASGKSGSTAVTTTPGS